MWREYNRCRNNKNLMSSELPTIEKVPGVLHQNPAERERESAELAAVEEAKRTRFFSECVAGNEALSAEQKEAIADAMSVRKTAAWVSFDGKDVKFLGVEVGEGVIKVTFDFYDGMNVVTEKIQQ